MIFAYFSVFAQGLMMSFRSVSVLFVLESSFRLAESTGHEEEKKRKEEIQIHKIKNKNEKINTCIVLY